MTMFLESPIPVIFIGIIAEAVLATFFFSMRQAWTLWAMLGVLVMVFAGVGLEWVVVTDVERVEAALDGAARALESNDLTQVEQYLTRDAVHTRGRVASAFRLVEITDAKIWNLNVTINRLASPPTADAEFHGRVYYDSRVETIPYNFYGARFKVELRREGDRWLVTDHIEYEEM